MSNPTGDNRDHDEGPPGVRGRTDFVGHTRITDQLLSAVNLSLVEHEDAGK